MIMGFGLILIVMGMILAVFDVFMPVTSDSVLLVWSLRMMGFVFGVIGIIVVGGRSYQTGAGIWMDLPSRDRVVCIHSGISGRRLDPNAKFIVAKDIGLGILKSRGKTFKDTGGGFRICGHDVRRTHEKIAADIPDWLGQYLYQIKSNWKVRNEAEMKQVYELLRNMENVDSIDEALVFMRGHKIFKPMLEDHNALVRIKKMSVDDLRIMREVLPDGETIHMENVYDFIKLAAPNELDTWIDQNINKSIMERRNYKDPSIGINWNTWLPALGMFGFMVMLGSVILLSYIGD